MLDGLAAVVFFHVAPLDQIAGDADDVAVAGVGGEVAHPRGKAALDDVQHALGVAGGGGLEGEDVAGAGDKVLLVAAAVAQVVVEFGLVADGDAHAGGALAVAVHPHLGMQEEAAAGLGAVGVVVGLDPLVNEGHDLIAQGVGHLVVAVAPVHALFFQQVVDALAHPHHPEHPGEAVGVDKPLSDQEVGAEESRFIDQKVDFGVHDGALHIDGPGQAVLEEVLLALGVEGDVVEQQPGQGVGAAAQQQPVVAAGDAVLVFTQVGGEHLVVGKGGLGAVQRRLYTETGKVVRRLVWVVEEGDVGGGVLQLPLRLQNEPAGGGGLGAQVAVAEGVGDGAVDKAHEVLDQDLGLRLILDKGLQQAVQLADEDGEVGGGGDVVIEDLQGVDGLPQIGGGIEAEELAALSHQLVVVGEDVAGDIGDKALPHGAHLVQFVLQLQKALRHGEALGVALGQAGELHHGLFMGQVGVADHPQNGLLKLSVFGIFFHGNILLMAGAVRSGGKGAPSQFVYGLIVAPGVY